MVDRKDKDVKKEVRKRHDSSSSSSSESSTLSTDSSSYSSTASSTRSGSSWSTETSRSPTPKKSTKDRTRRSIRRSRSPRALRVDRGDKATIASSRRSPTPEHRRRRSTPLKRRSSSSPKRRDRSRSREKHERSRSRDRKGSLTRKATPPPRRLCVRNLSRNVVKDHLAEIFGVYGSVKSCEMPMDRQHTHLGRGYGYVEFELPEDAEKALKHMDGGQIDGQDITCELTHPPRSSTTSGRRQASPHRYLGSSPRKYRSPPRGRVTGANVVPLGPSRFNRSHSRSPRRR